MNKSNSRRAEDKKRGMGVCNEFSIVLKDVTLNESQGNIQTIKKTTKYQTRNIVIHSI